MKSYPELQVPEAYFSIPLNECVVCLFYQGFFGGVFFWFGGEGAAGVWFGWFFLPKTSSNSMRFILLGRRSHEGQVEF